MGQYKEEAWKTLIVLKGNEILNKEKERNTKEFVNQKF